MQTKIFLLIAAVCFGVALATDTCTRSYDASDFAVLDSEQTTAVGFGSNNENQVSLFNLASVSVPRRLSFPTVAPLIEKLTGGLTHSIALDSRSKRAFVVGSGDDFELGLGPTTLTTKTYLPITQVVTGANRVSIEDDEVVLDVAAGWYHSCLVMRKNSSGLGKVYCAGSNYDGQIGGDTSSYFRLVVGDTNFENSDFAHVASGSEFTVACTTRGVCWSWGNNEAGQLGDGSTNGGTTPRAVLMPEETFFRKVDCFLKTCFAISFNGELIGWGSNAGRQFGTETGEFLTEPTVLIEEAVRDVSVGGDHVLAVIGDNSQLYTWGKGTNGQTAQPRSIAPTITTDWFVEGPTSVKEFEGVEIAFIKAGAAHSLVADACGNVYAFGANDFFQTFRSSQSQFEEAVKIGTYEGLTSIHSASYWSFIVSRDTTARQ